MAVEGTVLTRTPIIAWASTISMSRWPRAAIQKNSRPVEGLAPVGKPMRGDYARLAELSNQGARELGFADTGSLWRSQYDMTPEEFSADIERLWKQVEPLYLELHTYVRHKLIEKYGDAARRPDGMIPGHLLGNMWAQEWGNIYDVVAPPSGPMPYDLGAILKRATQTRSSWSNMARASTSRWASIPA